MEKRICSWSEAIGNSYYGKKFSCFYPTLSPFLISLQLFSVPIEQMKSRWKSFPLFGCGFTFPFIDKSGGMNGLRPWLSWSYFSVTSHFSFHHFFLDTTSSNIKTLGVPRMVCSNIVVLPAIGLSALCWWTLLSTRPWASCNEFRPSFS